MLMLRRGMRIPGGHMGTARRAQVMAFARASWSSPRPTVTPLPGRVRRTPEIRRPIRPATLLMYEILRYLVRGLRTIYRYEIQ